MNGQDVKVFESSEDFHVLFLHCGYILHLFEIFLKFRNNGCKLSANSL